MLNPNSNFDNYKSITTLIGIMQYSVHNSHVRYIFNLISLFCKESQTYTTIDKGRRERESVCVCLCVSTRACLCNCAHVCVSIHPCTFLS